MSGYNMFGGSCFLMPPATQQLFAEWCCDDYILVNSIVCIPFAWAPVPTPPSQKFLDPSVFNLQCICIFVIIYVSWFTACRINFVNLLSDILLHFISSVDSCK